MSTDRDIIVTGEPEPASGGDDELAEQFAEWRDYLQSRRGLTRADADELEDHLRGTVNDLIATGLRADEAFLIAVKRMGSLDDLSREFAREHSDRLWKQLVLAGEPGGAATGGSRRDLYAMVVCAALAVVAVKVPELFGKDLDNDHGFYPPNFSLFALPFLAAFLAWRRRAKPRLMGVLVGLFALGAVAANAYPLAQSSQSALLTDLHLPLALWFVVGLAYVDGDWRSSRRRMDFIRFTGEWSVYFVLIAVGGGVLIGFTLGVFAAIGVDAAGFVTLWLLPCGVVASVVVAGWLVEAKQGVVENMAPVLTKIFTPLFTVVLLALLVAMASAGHGDDTQRGVGVLDTGVDRDVLILFDLMLVLVLGLLLYSISARDPLAPPNLFDRLQLALVMSALAIDLLVLLQIIQRISEWGTTPNKAAALGENVVLLANLAWSAWLLVGFLRRQQVFGAIERWQTTYLPVYAAWLWIVVLVFPPVFWFR